MDTPEQVDYDDYDEFEKDVKAGLGTYLKVIQYQGHIGDDCFLVLYLRPRGMFLFAGYWSGYERSLAVGSWVRAGAELHLEGHGHLSLDVMPGPPGGCFKRVFQVEDSNRTPCLIASDELKDWSLLGWSGTFMYVGLRTIINPHGDWLPDSLTAVDERISKMRQVNLRDARR